VKRVGLGRRLTQTAYKMAGLGRVLICFFEQEKIDVLETRAIFTD